MHVNVGGPKYKALYSPSVPSTAGSFESKTAVSLRAFQVLYTYVVNNKGVNPF